MREAGESRIDDDALAADVTSILDHTDKTVNSTKRSGVGDRTTRGAELLDDDVDEASGGKRRRTDHDGPGSGAGSPRATGSEGRPEDVPDTHEDDDFGDEMAGGFLGKHSQNSYSFASGICSRLFEICIRQMPETMTMTMLWTTLAVKWITICLGPAFSMILQRKSN